MSRSKSPVPIEEIVERFRLAQENNIVALAKEIGVSRPTLYKMVEDYYIANPGKRPPSAEAKSA